MSLIWHLLDNDDGEHNESRNPPKMDFPAVFRASFLLAMKALLKVCVVLQKKITCYNETEQNRAAMASDLCM